MMNKIVSKYKSFPVQVRAAFWFLICSFLQKAVSTITTPVFTRLLTAGEYGQYNVFNSWLNIITTLVSLKLYLGVYSLGLVKFSEKRELYSSSMQGLNLTLSAGWTLIYLAFHNFWNQLLGLTTVQMLAMLVMIWSTSVFSFWAAEQRVEYKYRTLVIATAIISFLKPTVGILFVVLAEDKVTARILGLALVELAGYSGFFFVQIRRGKKFVDLKFWKYALLFNIPLVPHYLSQTILNSADRIMISSMVSKDAAGIYSLAYSISQIMTLFNQSLTQTLTPWIYTRIKEDKIEDISHIAYLSMLLIAGVNLLLIIMAPEVVAIFAPAAYYDAIYVMPPVAMSVFFMFCYELFAKFELYYEKTSWITLATASGALLNILLNAIFIRRFGYYAAGYTTLVCYILYAVFHYSFMKIVCRKNTDGRCPYRGGILVGISIIFMALGFGIMTLYRRPVWRYGLILLAALFLLYRRKQLMTVFREFLKLKKKEKNF